jgi:VWFA-related protein
LITDGRENDSHHGANEVRNLLAESGVLLYSISVLDTIRLAHKGGMRVQDTLDRLSEVTGGLALYPGSDTEMNAVFDLVAIELRHQYSIAYRPRNLAADGKWHQIKVQITQASPSNIKVRSKEGYFAPAKPGQ